ncbi:MAG: hypothetical protein ACI8V2_003879, partial [Candidatus Latescibacterota bacterium]
MVSLECFGEGFKRSHLVNPAFTPWGMRSTFLKQKQISCVV